MSKAGKQLTVKRTAKLTEPGRYRDPETRGLYLQVAPGGTQSWLLRYELNGRERFHGLGSADDFSLKEARERARKARQLLSDGVDPVEHKRAEKAAAALVAAKRREAVTFAQAVTRYLEKKSPEWRSAKSVQMFRSRMTRFAFPVIGRLPVEEVDKRLVMRVLEPLWRSKPESASRLRHGIEAVLNWAAAHDLRPAGFNPAAWKGSLAELLPAPGKVRAAKPHAAMDYREVPSFVAELRQRGGITASALELTILTAARTGETLSATWDEFDLDAGLWTVPAARMKSNREHVVPLSKEAIKLLKALPVEDGNEFVFIGTRANAKSSLAKNSMLLLLDRMGRRGVTAHGFRSAFRTWAAERSALPDHIAELCLAHSIGGEVERTYKRTTLIEQRRLLMQQWAKFLAAPVVEGGEVVPLRKRKAV